jgi:hypothetical protein
MYRIQLLKEGQIVETVEADTSDIGEIAHQASELERRHATDDWEIVNGLGQRVVSKTRWRTVMGELPPREQ